MKRPESLTAHPSSEVAGRHVSVNGEHYFVRDPGGAGPVVLLLHGWPDDSTLWRDVQRTMSEQGYRAIAVDWLAHGQSSMPRDPTQRCAVPRLSADTIALLDALALPRVHLVAHDYGATVSWETVAQHPERFLTYTAISVGPSLEIMRDVLAGGLFRYHWLVLHGLAASIPWYLANDARRFRAKFASHPDAERILERLRRGDPTFFTIWERANPAYVVLWRQLQLGRERRRIRVPTLALYGRADEWMTEGQLARGQDGVDAPWRYCAIDGGHWIPLERADAVSAEVLDWLARHPG